MTKEFTSATDAAGPLGSASSDGLGPLPPHRKVTAHGRMWTEEDMRSYAAREVAAERERLKTLAHKRAGYEAASAAHHAGKWHAAFENHLTRNAAMCDLIDALFGPNEK